MFELVDTVSQQAVIKVIGVGGGGGNAVEHMLDMKVEGVEFINANTDAQMLSRSSAPVLLQLGESLTKGLGAGANPEVGRQAAMEDRDRIESAIQGADMLFITAGMGGGTGTGAAPVIAEIARERGILTVAVVTRPFSREGKKRHAVADQGIDELQDHVDSLIIIPNEKVLSVMGHDVSMEDAFRRANEVLFNAVQGISELITRRGSINLDFADVRAVMSETGMAMMGSATASGENRAAEAARNALFHPLLEDTDLHGAKGLLVNIIAANITLGEYDAIASAIHEYATADTNIVIGTASDEEMGEDLRVTIVATGLQDSRKKLGEPPSTADTPAQGNAAKQSPQPLTEVPAAGKRFNRAGTAMAQSGTQEEIQNLDIPAFLRKQAD